MSYKKLVIWQLSRDISIRVHAMTLRLPKFEQFEEGQQIRRSSKSVRSNIVEGYGRRMYKMDFVKFIIYAIASNDETLDHLEILYETKSLQDTVEYTELYHQIELLRKKLISFLQAIQRHHQKPR